MCGLLIPGNIWRRERTTVLKTADLEYDLPQERIATSPAEPRDAARLLVCSRSHASIEHRVVRDLPQLLAPGDLLVFNTSRVLPARLLGRREDTGGAAEVLYLEQGPDASTWIAMVRARRVKPGAPIRLLDREGRKSTARLTLASRVSHTPGAWNLNVEVDGAPLDSSLTPDLLERVGHPPLPPYIRAARKALHQPEETAEDVRQYQTVYATEPGSVAAPTAGLHFTPALLDALRSRDIDRADVVLHVGPGTFKPIEADVVEAHPMHAEWCSMSPDAVERIQAARAAGRRIVPVGTTSARTLESYAQLGADQPASIRTRLLITPGHKWQWTDALLTNFHLPHSTLMAMVAALLDDGLDRLKEIYAVAIAEGYRFYSYGDAMLILP
jgi:S-adenosylmethionine:tRNA ribosyltransferase-isomerase